MKCVRNFIRPLSLALLLAVVLVPSSVLAGKRLGAELGDAEITLISSLLAKPAEFVGKTVKVQGRVVDLCHKHGKWMELASDKEFETLKLVSGESGIVFPVEVKGKVATALGTFAALELSLEQSREYLEHMAIHKGQEFDPESVTEPVVLYQLEVAGVAVDD